MAAKVRKTRTRIGAKIFRVVIVVVVAVVVVVVGVSVDLDSRFDRKLTSEPKNSRLLILLKLNRSPI